MIERRQDNILQADAEAIVNTVNSVGVMGRGLALQFKKAYPDNFKAYQLACKNDEIHPGKVFTFKRSAFCNPKFIINFPTKRHWKEKSKIEYISQGLDSLIQEIKSLNITSIAIPPLGCGLGGLNWNEVRPLIEQAFATLPDVSVFLYEPAGSPKPKDQAKSLLLPKMTKGRAALLSLMRKYLAAAMDPSITLLEMHKLMYFMQVSGEDLTLNFEKGPYGPYAKNLRHVLNVIEGHFIVGYGDAEDNPEKQIELLPNAIESAADFLKDHSDTEVHFKKVTDLIQGFETPFGMELLATVHWVAAHEGAQNASQAQEKIYTWNERKHMFQAHHIEVAWNILQQKGWLNLLSRANETHQPDATLP